MRLWDGQFSKISRTSSENKWDILAVHRTRVPQTHQTSMYHMPKEGDPQSEADTAFWIVRSKIIEKCAAEDLALYETPEGRFFVRMPNATALHEININVRCHAEWMRQHPRLSCIASHGAGQPCFCGYGIVLETLRAALYLHKNHRVAVVPASALTVMHAWLAMLAWTGTPR